jgi:hypothetical protein
MLLRVLSSVQKVVAQSRHVFMHPEAVEPAVRRWGSLKTGPEGWHHPCHFFDGTEETVRWIFVLDVLNHCFWPDVGEPVWTVTFEGRPWSGYWGLAASLKRAQRAGVPLTRSTFLAAISAETLRHIFSGDGEIPLFEERLFNLREAGRILQSQWQGDFVHVLASAAGDAVRAVRNIVDSFPSFRDDAYYRGETVYFWKRAQICVADIHAAFEGKGRGQFSRIDELTAFADYKLPQVLRELGVIIYHPELARKVDAMELLEPGGEEEVEIRAMTVWAVEAFKEVFRRNGREVTSAWIDHWLWQLGQEDRFRKRPYHRCRTIFY